MCTRISSCVRAARSRCSRKTVASLRVFLFRPISPIPSTPGRSRNSGIIAITSRDSDTFSASLALMHSQVVVLDAVRGGPLALVFGQLAEVVAKTLDARTIETSPERRLAHEHASGHCHSLVIVGHPRDHVNVRIYI